MDRQAFLDIQDKNSYNQKEEIKYLVKNNS
jgi:hypothetical protein